MKKRTNVELVRFIASVIILMYHSNLLSNYQRYPVQRGYLCVEFFLMISGFFTVMHMEKYSRQCTDRDGLMKYSMQYTVSKIFRFFPYVLIGTLLCYIWRFCFIDLTMDEKVFLMFYFPYEVMGLQMTGISKVLANTPIWYISTLIIVLPLVAYCSVKIKDFFSGYLVWLGPQIIYGALYTKNGALNGWGNQEVFLQGSFRALAGLLAGAALFYASQKIMNIKVKSLTKLLLTVLEVVLYGLGFASMNWFLGVSLDCAVVGVLFGALLLTFSEITYSSNLSSKFVEFLGKLSLPAYCVHWGIYLIINSWKPELSYWKKMIISMGIIFVISAVGVFMNEKIFLNKK